MTIRRRLALAAGIAVAVAVAAASLSAYLVVRTRLLVDVDSGLREQVARVTHGERPLPPLGIARRRARFGDPEVYAQIITADGSRSVDPNHAALLPVTERDRAVAAGTEGAYLWDAEVRGVQLRGITAAMAPGVAIEIARPVDEIQSVLGGLGVVLLTVTGAGVAMGAGLGWLVSGRALRPVMAFTGETEALADTGDLSQRLPEGGGDEIGRLARVFNATLDQLEASAEAQRRLVADASHELRTPLASLRANVEVLQQPDALPPDEHAALLRDVVQQTDELGALVSDIAHAGERAQAMEEIQDVRLDEIVQASIERTRRLSPGIVVVASLSDTVVDGVPERLARLVANLLDNAVKWNPQGQPIDVHLHDRMLSVRDHGRGFSDKDLPHVFDRFYRSTAARGMPGSGLGLSIVRQVADMHGATVTAANAPDGGAITTVLFPPLSPGEDDGPRERREV